MRVCVALRVQGRDGIRGRVATRSTRVVGGRGYIPLPAQLAVSNAALIVPDMTEEFVRDDLAGLGAAVDDFRARHRQPDKRL